jgi:hypothetical protein
VHAHGKWRGIAAGAQAILVCAREAGERRRKRGGERHSREAHGGVGAWACSRHGRPNSLALTLPFNLLIAINKNGLGLVKSNS